MHTCRTCGYRFEDADALRRHTEEGSGCNDRPEFAASDSPLPGLSHLGSPVVEHTTDGSVCDEPEEGIEDDRCVHGYFAAEVTA